MEQLEQEILNHALDREPLKGTVPTEQSVIELTGEVRCKSVDVLEVNAIGFVGKRGCITESRCLLSLSAWSKRRRNLGLC